MADSYWSSSRYVKAAIREVGLGWFSKKIIGIYPTREAAVAKEVRLHTFLNVKDHPLFFNRANQTTVHFSHQRDLKQLKLQSERQRGNTYALGRTHSQVTKDKIAASKRGQRHTPEIRAKMMEARRTKTPMLGKHQSQEIREGMTARMQGNTLFLGKHHSQETRESISSSMKAFFQSNCKKHPKSRENSEKTQEKAKTATNLASMAEWSIAPHS